MSTQGIQFSVVMTVYDNARELEEHLPAFLNQEYAPGYEVIVVDESSTDNTDDILKLQKQSHPHLYTTFLPKPNREVVRKRLALTIGVKASKNEWVILSSIDKYPSTSEWLNKIVGSIDSTTSVVLGYFTKKAVKLQAFEAISQAENLIKKAERKKADGHKGKILRYLNGQYDFAIVKREEAHELLKYFEQSIGWPKLQSLRLCVMLHNLIH